MAISFEDALAQLRGQIGWQVPVVLTIHDSDVRMDQYGSTVSSVFYAYGNMVYQQGQVLGSRAYILENLVMAGQSSMKVIHSLAYNPGVTGNNPHDYQRFLVDEAAAEYWNINIQSVLITIPLAPGLVLPPPVATFDMAQYRARPGYSVPLSSQGVFLTGFGESPLDPNRQAQYTFTFGDGVPVIS